MNTNGPQYRLQLVEALAPRLRDLSLYGYRPDTAADVADALVAAGGTQLTQLVRLGARGGGMLLAACQSQAVGGRAAFCWRRVGLWFGTRAKLGAGQRTVYLAVPPGFKQYNSDPFAAQECSGLECLWHLPAWPHLQVLLLWRVLPTSVQAQHVALLAAGPSLRRLAFSRYALQSFGRGQASRSQEERQLEVRWQPGWLSIVAWQWGPSSAAAGCSVVCKSSSADLMCGD